ncbi:hypothetical protein G4_37 [Propionibacterium phage G4]|uniref:Uncharacterized protein n=1 Tax=Propionibacterium phage G4 TaxID=1897537 RepID=A0A1D8EUI1_9CAUD|nr:hypothetical protein FDH12_gp37 [Propionibacterium phage G4]AOT24626.1 hypothetical protein G4_37 [Propionibacterium phage G4]
MSTAAVETPDVKVPATPVGSRFFKAARPDGTDFHSGTVRWLPADGAPIPEGGWIVEHPHPGQVGSWDAAGYLSAASVETDCTGFLWPARLLLVEPAATMWTPCPDSFPHERDSIRWRVVKELPAWRLFGPQGGQVASLIEQTAHLTSTQIEDMTAARGTAWGARTAAWGAAWVAAQDAARGAALDAAWYAAQDAARDAALDALLGWLVKDLISVEDFRTLTGPWEQVMGRVIA